MRSMSCVIRKPAFIKLLSCWNMSIKMNCRRSNMHQFLRFEVLTTMLLKMLRRVDCWIITDVSKNRIFMFWSSSPRTTVAVWHNEGEKGGELRSGWCCASDWPVSSAVATVLGLINPEYCYYMIIYHSIRLTQFCSWSCSPYLVFCGDWLSADYCHDGNGFWAFCRVRSSTF
jgi:hypothetical protein